MAHRLLKTLDWGCNMLREKLDELSTEWAKEIYDRLEKQEGIEIQPLSGFKAPKDCLEAAIHNWLIDFCVSQCAVCGDCHSVYVPRSCETGDGV